MWKKELEVALEAAEQAAILTRHLIRQPAHQLQIRYKMPGDPVTLIDTLASEKIEQVLRAAFPNDDILNEEGSQSGNCSRRWVIDPLDGSKNLPNYRLVTNSVCLEVNGEIVVASVAAPFEETLTYAVKGEGAHILRNNGEESLTMLRPETLRDRASRIAELDGLNNQEVAWRVGRFREALAVESFSGGAAEIRSLGSGILALIHVAQNIADLALCHAICGFWDLAAASLILPESGKFICGIDGQPLTQQSVGAFACQKEHEEELLKRLYPLYQGYLGYVCYRDNTRAKRAKSQ